MKSNDWFAVIAYILSTLLFVLFLKYVGFTWAAIVTIEILCLAYIAMSVFTKWALEDATEAVNRAFAQQVAKELAK